MVINEAFVENASDPRVFGRGMPGHFPAQAEDFEAGGRQGFRKDRFQVLRLTGW